ncbi:MAG: hypothetical protein ABIQ52_10405 [Vicinamibacterales bacterium]
MFYFFEKDQRYIRCEIKEEADGWDLLRVEADGIEQIEHFPTSQSAFARWQELQAGLKHEGWFGPYGRD